MMGFSRIGFPADGWNLEITVSGTGSFIFLGDLLFCVVMVWDYTFDHAARLGATWPFCYPF